jgi:pyridoxamine 5'-phosphate oxidase
MPLVRVWLDEALAPGDKNPWSMALATAAAGGQPSVRYVLLKELSASKAHLVFFTNYGSRKATELEGSGFAACVLYWRDSGRQLRFEGRIERSPADESDAYFASRPRQSQLNAWASEQSRPVESPDDVSARLTELEKRFPEDAPVPRPEYWGGYRLRIAAVEFWVEGQDRFHERLRYERGAGGSWSAVWLAP